MANNKFQGCWPVAPTPFKDNGELDIEGMKRVLDCMVDQNVDGICILAVSYTHLTLPTIYSV